jgi:hypothetical protein
MAPSVWPPENGPARGLIRQSLEKGDRRTKNAS